MPRAMSASARVPNDWTTTRLLCRTRALYARDDIAQCECVPFHLDDKRATEYVAFDRFRLSDDPTHPDLMHRTNNCASLSPFTDCRERTTESRGSTTDLPADSSCHIRSVIRDGTVKPQR